MTTGTITSLRDRGFGFITPDGGTTGELFFHHSAVVDGGFEQLQEGQPVTFEQEPDPRDPNRQRAVQVALAPGEGGRVLISTAMDRNGDQVGDRLQLRPLEGVVVG